MRCKIFMLASLSIFSGCGQSQPQAHEVKSSEIIRMKFLGATAQQVATAQKSEVTHLNCKSAGGTEVTFVCDYDFDGRHRSMAFVQTGSGAWSPSGF